jgi:membrane protein
MKKTQQKKHSGLYMLGQSIYLTTVYYIQNNLYNSAAACAFGFLFSFIPIIMMVLAVLVRILHASPSFINSIFSFTSQYRNMFDVQSFVNTLLGYHTFGWVDFLLILFIIWMARKFFATIMQGINRIFHYKAPLRPLFNQFIIFAGELVLVVLSVIIIFVMFTAQQIFTQPALAVLRNQNPHLLGTTSKIFINIFVYLLIFIFVTIAYRFAAGTKPELKLCVISSAVCTVIFFIISKLINFFLNIESYNLIYGVLSNVMILLFEVYIFFTLFLTCAQVIYVLQFFDSLLLGELYLLPERNDTAVISIIKRVLFINPAALMNKDDVVKIEAGGIIYSKDDTTDDSYYVLNGTVVLNRSDNLTYYDKGAFFGEQACILNKPRAGEAKALSDCELIKVPADSFRALLENDARAAEKALSQVSDYVAKVYGRTSDFLV